jgi:hypothetical protein
MLVAVGGFLLGWSSIVDRMVSIYRTLLDLGTLYVCYDEAFGERNKIVDNTSINYYGDLFGPP